MYSDHSVMVRVAIADHEALRGQILALLLEEQDDMMVTEVYGDQVLLLRGLQAQAADVLIIDPSDGSAWGLELVRRITVDHPDLVVLLLTSQVDDACVHAALHAGARGCLSRSSDVEEMLRAVRSLAAGGSLISQAQSTAGRPTNRVSDLTRREQDVLVVLTQGASNREIAAHLGLTEKTVKNYVSQILCKLEVRDRTQAALSGLRLGLIPDWDQRAAAGRSYIPDHAPCG